MINSFALLCNILQIFYQKRNSIKAYTWMPRLRNAIHLGFCLTWLNVLYSFSFYIAQQSLCRKVLHLSSLPYQQVPDKWEKLLSNNTATVTIISRDCGLVSSMRRNVGCGCFVEELLTSHSIAHTDHVHWKSCNSIDRAHFETVLGMV